MILIPKSAGELKPFLHQVLLNAKGRWLVQRSVLNCNKIMCWKLLTEAPLHKIHALRILQDINGKAALHLMWDAETASWVEKPADFFNNQP